MRRRIIIGITALSLAVLGGFVVSVHSQPITKAASTADQSNLRLSLDVWNGRIVHQEVKATGNAKVTISTSPPWPASSVPPPVPRGTTATGYTGVNVSSARVSISDSSTQITSTGDVNIHHSSSSSSSNGSSTNRSSVHITINNH